MPARRCTTSASPARCATGSRSTPPRRTRSSSWATTTSGCSSTGGWPSISAASTPRSAATRWWRLHDRSGHVNATNNYGMTNGNVYEVVVFQAERQKTSSSYQLTLSAFNGAPTACGPTCGDRVVTPPEQCDNGTANNTGGYNKCTADCKLGPYCGDMMVTDGETCDNGRNDDSYGATTGCGPGCKLPARCGDLIVQTEYGEQCDDGTNSGAYGGCTQSVPARRLLRRRQGAEPAGAVRRRRQRRHLRQLRRPERCRCPTASSARAAATASSRTSTASSASRRASNDPELHGGLPSARDLRRRRQDRARGVRLRRGRQQRRIRRLRAGLHPGAPLRRRGEERARGVRRRRPRQQLRRLLAAVQAGALTAATA